jgi:CBS domain-containing membrane protein
LNSCILVGLGLLFHKLSKRNYPHVASRPAENTHQTADLPSSLRAGLREEDIDAALEALDETFDIDRADLRRLLQQVELQATIRSNAGIRCADVMSRDVIAVGEDAEPDHARALLLKHNISILPVKDRQGRLIGTVGLRELSERADRMLISKPVVADAADPALSLLPVLTDGRTHAVIVTDGDSQIRGLISQTDLLNAVVRLLPSENGAAAVPAAA